MKALMFVILSLALLSGCESTKKTEVVFKHDLVQEVPWTHQNFVKESSDFTFAIISDLNGGEREGIFEVAIQQLNILGPEFIVSVGDLINGGTENRTQLAREWDSFDKRASKAKAPFFYVGGNHDLTNVVMREVWKERYGPRYYHFVYKDVLFLMLDSEDYTEERMQEIYNERVDFLKVYYGPEPEKAREMPYMQIPERSTGEISSEQSAYFEEVLSRYPDVHWTFLLMHKPVWQREDESGLGPIEHALADRPYTVINGHVHSYLHTSRRGMDYIMLGTTGGSQNAGNLNAYDHVTLVKMTKQGPLWANLKLGGILNKEGEVPGKTEDLCF